MRWYTLAAAGLALSSPLAAQQPAKESSGTQRIREAAIAVQEINDARLLREPAYAAAIAGHLLVLRGAAGRDPEGRHRFHRALVYVLAAGGQHDRAQTEADALLRAYLADATSYDVALFAAHRAARWPRAAEISRRAMARLPAEGRAEALGPRIASVMSAMLAAGERDVRARIAEDLIASGWPGGGEAPDGADWLRMVLVDRALERGDVAAARRHAGQVHGLATVLQLVTDRRYDRLQEGADRDAAVRAAILREDRTTAARLAAAPEDVGRLVERASYLRSVGRNRDVLDLLLPLMGEVRLVAERHPRGLWLVNEAAFSLIATGEAGQAAELMRPLSDMDMDAHPELVNTSINFVSVLWQAGRSEEALQRADALMAANAEHASDYGEMWIAANAVCAAADLRRTADADAWLARTDGIAASNPSAMLQALLCRNDLDRAERVLLAALGDEATRSSVIVWLQDFEPQAQAAAAERLREAFKRLRARPAVEAALARSGHRLRLPIPAAVHGWY
jgi:hypothetical protein